ncbi:unnamed protein product [Effrenium voratum]|nr:unnamed protein product [Effrenium voratum]
MGRPNTEQKLDMALDDLVKCDEDIRHGPAKKSRPSVQDGPYAKGRNRGAPGDKRRQRLPPEEKALLKTQCFFNDDKDLVIKLYDTQVLVIKEKPGEKSQEKDSEEPAPGSLALVLTSGGFRTAETKAILNEALKPMALHVEGGPDSKWSLRSDYKTPGQVTNGSSTQPFEDGMEVLVPAVVTLTMVQENLASRKQSAKGTVEVQRKELGAGRGPGTREVPGQGA